MGSKFFLVGVLLASIRASSAEPTATSIKASIMQAENLRHTTLALTNGSDVQVNAVATDNDNIAARFNLIENAINAIASRLSLNIALTLTVGSYVQVAAVGTDNDNIAARFNLIENAINAITTEIEKPPIGKPTYDDCCEDLLCWENCFVNPLPELEDTYNQVYKIIMGIRSLYSPCSNPHGTCFSLDSSTHSLPNPTPADMMEFERTLAAIIAMAQPVSNDRNPFFFNKFYGTIPWGITWTEQNWNCKDNCDAADVLLHPTGANDWAMNHHFPEMFPDQMGPSGVHNHGCGMCKAMFDGKVYGTCHEKTTDELMVAFVNGDIDWMGPPGMVSSCSAMNRVMIGTNPSSNLIDMMDWAAPSGLAYQVPFNDVSLRAARALLDCMRHRCCSYRKQWEPQGPMAPTVWWYMNTTIPTVEKRQKERREESKALPKKFYGTWDEFATILNGSSSGEQGCECGLECTMPNGQIGVCQGDRRTCAINISLPNCFEATSTTPTTTTGKPQTTPSPTATMTTTTTTTNELRIDGEWSTWSTWESCSKTCGGGKRSRSRRCDSPPPMGTGRNCLGSSTQTEQCNEKDCPTPCVDEYPRNYQCKSTVPCSKLKRKCNKTFMQALSTKCEKRMSAADLRKKVNTYCKKTCRNCNSRSMADGRMGGDEYSDYYGYNDYTNDTAMA